MVELAISSGRKGAGSSVSGALADAKTPKRAWVYRGPVCQFGKKHLGGLGRLSKEEGLATSGARKLQLMHAGHYAGVHCGHGSR